MNTKLLLLLGVLLGALALAMLVPWSGHQAPESSSQLIDSADFVVELKGTPILQETYTLEFDPTKGYLLNSQGTILANGQKIALGEQTQYDANFVPMSYQLAADTPSGTQIISAQMGTNGLKMEVRVGLSSQTAQVDDVDNIALLDNNLIGQYAVLLRAIRAEALDRSFTAAIPQALLSLPSTIGGPNSTTFRSGDQEYEGKQFDLHLGDVDITLVEYQGRLVGLVNQSQGTVGYDKDEFPDGITIEEPVGETSAGDAIERDVTFQSDGLTLAGTLRLPASGDGPFPAVVFLAGSGPVDRDGNAIDLSTGSIAMAIDIQRQLAVALSDAGIASLRYDKRGVGASEGDETLASRSDLLDDARAAIAALRDQPEIDPSRVILIGHSEGAYLAPVLAVDDPTIAGVVLLSGAARPLGDITRWQVQTLLEQQGVEGAALDTALAQQDAYIEFVKTSKGEWSDYTVADIEAALPWMNDAAASQLLSAPLALSWLRQHYLADPSATLSQLKAPVLVISGEKDMQVPSSEAELIRDALEAGGNDDVSVHVLPNLNHLLRYHPEEPNLTYRHVSDPVDPRVIDLIRTWILDHFGS